MLTSGLVTRLPVWSLISTGVRFPHPAFQINTNMSTYFTVYKTTNLVNGKIYIGKHVTSDLDDAYLGSGKLLNAAIKKYGKENFKKEILFVFDSEDLMNSKEKELVTSEFTLLETNYNLCPGGHGGFGYINNNEPLRKAKNQKAMQIAKANGIQEKAKEGLQRFLSNPENIINRTKLWSDTIKSKYTPDIFASFKGKHHTDETKAKMSASSKGRGTGQNNSQFDTMWITNGFQSKKIKRSSFIPSGWRKGRASNPKDLDGKP